MGGLNTQYICNILFRWVMGTQLFPVINVLFLVDWVTKETLLQKVYANLKRKLLYKTLYDDDGENFQISQIYNQPFIHPFIHPPHPSIHELNKCPILFQSLQLLKWGKRNKSCFLSSKSCKKEYRKVNSYITVWEEIYFKCFRAQKKGVKSRSVEVIFSCVEYKKYKSIFFH